MIWRLLASTLDDRPQRQIMKHEQAMNDGKNKVEQGGHLAGLPGGLTRPA